MGGDDFALKQKFVSCNPDVPGDPWEKVPYKPKLGEGSWLIARPVGW